MLQPIDKLEIQILVDNATDSLSSNPTFVESEFAYLKRKGMRVLSGGCLCCAAHGLSCLITAHRGTTRHVVLFDTGPEADTFERNVDRLGLDLGMTEAIVLSHGHWDHAGGMLRALELMRADGRTQSIPFYAHPGMFRARARQLPNGEMLPMEDVPGITALTERGADVVLSTEPQAFLDDMFYVSGEIPRVTPFEQGLPFHFQRSLDGQRWDADPTIVDERWLGAHVAGRGLVVLTACSHAGVINVLADAQAKFPGVPLYAVVGGLHLSGPTESLIPASIRELRRFGLTTIAAGHCTGWRAMSALLNEFGDKTLAPLAVGKLLTF